MSKTCKEKDRLPNLLLNEGPEVVGCIATVLEGGGSLDTAVREIAKNGPPCSAKLFRRIVEDSELRIECDLLTAISRLISELPEGCSSYGLALRMAVTAADAKDPNERTRLLKEAADISLRGLSEAGKTFAASLNAPCMAIFGLGIMVPMVLMSIMPMMSLSGLFGASAVDLRSIAVITLVLIPCAVLAMIAGINRRNPMASVSPKGSPLEFLPFLMVFPVLVLSHMLFDDWALSVCLSVVAASILALVSGLRKDRAMKCRTKAERDLGHILLEIGNRLTSGIPFENSVTESLEGKKSLKAMAGAFRNEMQICRGDVEAAISNVFSSVSQDIADSLTEIYRTSVRNLVEAGRLSISLGRRINDRSSIRKSIRNELKGMCDTMYGTAAVFAPLVLGLSVSMLEPLKRLSEGIDSGATSLVLSIYLCELCSVIALLLSFIEGSINYRTVVRKMSGMCIVSLTVFMLVLRISL